MTKPFKADVLVVKLSGKALTADKALDALFTALAGSAASAERTRVVLVHGGGVEVDALMRGLGRRIDRIEGLRVSPAEDMAVIAGALAGTCSLKLRGAAQRAGLMPLGLCATDAGIGRVVPADPRLGRVGVIEPGDSAAKRRLQALLDAGFTPVISSVGMPGRSGTLMPTMRRWHQLRSWVRRSFFSRMFPACSMPINISLNS